MTIALPCTPWDDLTFNSNLFHATDAAVRNPRLPIAFPRWIDETDRLFSPVSLLLWCWKINILKYVSHVSHNQYTRQSQCCEYNRVTVTHTGDLQYPSVATWYLLILEVPVRKLWPQGSFMNVKLLKPIGVLNCMLIPYADDVSLMWQPKTPVA